MYLLLIISTLKQLMKPHQALQTLVLTTGQSSPLSLNAM